MYFFYIYFFCRFLFASFFFFFFFNDTATTEIYTLSLHDALPIDGSEELALPKAIQRHPIRDVYEHVVLVAVDRKSTRLNSSHLVISYAVFCLKKKKKINTKKLIQKKTNTQTTD